MNILKIRCGSCGGNGCQHCENSGMKETEFDKEIERALVINNFSEGDINANNEEGKKFFLRGLKWGLNVTQTEDPHL